MPEASILAALVCSDRCVTRWSGPVSHSQSEAVSA